MNISYYCSEKNVILTAVMKTYIFLFGCNKLL